MLFLLITVNVVNLVYYILQIQCLIIYFLIFLFRDFIASFYFARKIIMELKKEKNGAARARRAK